MQPFFSRIDTSKMFKTALSVLLGAALLQTPIGAEDDLGYLSVPTRKGGKESEIFPVEDEIHNTPSLKALQKNKDTYTINFNNVSITEYIRFASKIAKLNFNYSEDDLKFNVTIVSEETSRRALSEIIGLMIEATVSRLAFLMRKTRVTRGEILFDGGRSEETTVASCATFLILVIVKLPSCSRTIKPLMRRV